MVDLSAGNDSRITAAALSENRDVGSKITFRVIGGADNPDVVGARQLAARAGLRLRVCAPQKLEIGSIDKVIEAARLGDSSYFFSDILVRRDLDHQFWSEFRYHIGSLGGQLFRNWMWMYTILNAGRTTEMNYKSLLKHRIYNNPEVDIAGMTKGKLSLAEHNEFLLEAAKEIDRIFPRMINVNKLELIHVQNITQRSIFWALEDYLNITLPYLWSEMTAVSMTLHYAHKLNRRLILKAVERLNGVLGSVKTDLRAPFFRLNPTNIHHYFYYIVTYGYDVLTRHYFLKPFAKKVKPAFKIPEALRGLFLDLLTENSFSEYGRSMEPSGHLHSNSLSPEVYSELMTVFHLLLLKQSYQGVQLQLDFTAPSPIWHEKDMTLL
jgi:hypothetical protein